MIKFLTTQKTAWIGFLVALVASFIMATTTHAQESTEGAAEKYGVSYPIAQLGGCADYSACRSFCEDPLNATSCINYAKQKGFYQEDKFEVNDRVLQAAKKLLGCDSKASCLNFCEVSANHDKCDSFAKSQGLVGGQVEDLSRTQVITRAKEVLGCDSTAGCQSLCSKEENRQKCSEFAKTVGLHGGQQQVGPGGCTSEATCKAFCSDPNNYSVCSGFSSTSGGTFTGPGGCNSEASCRTYCQENEDQCRRGFVGPGGSPPPGYNPQEMCNKTPNCAWKENTCHCGFYGETEESARKASEYASYCQANPDKCQPGQAASFGSEEQRKQFEEYCRQNPDRCRPSNTSDGTSTGGYQPGYSASPYSTPYYGSRETQEAGCRAGGGTCNWSSGYCNCQGYTSGGSTSTSGSGSTATTTPYPASTSAPSNMTRENQESGCRSCGGTCSWNGDFCNCQCQSSGSTSTGSTPQPTTSSTETQTSQGSTTSTQDPATACAQTSGCSWNGSSCQCGSTQGVSTNRGLLQIILEWLRF